MKITLPGFGVVRTGEDAIIPEVAPNVKAANPTKIKGDIGAGFLDLHKSPLSGEKSISTKLIQSFYGWVFANVSVLAEEVSKMEFELYKVVIVKGVPEYQRITQHPLLDLLDQPNPFTTTSEFIYNLEAHLELTGDGFILLDKPMMPTQMFALQPDKITVNPGAADERYEIKNYELKDTIDGKKVVKTYKPDVIIHEKTPNPANPYRGKSVVEAAALTIDTDNLAREFIKIFFKNGASPNFALSSDQRLTDADITRIEAQLKKSYAGVRNAFKTAIFGGGIKPVTVQQSNKEIEFQAMQLALRDEIMAMFKNTKASLGIVEDVNRANAEASIESWKQSVIKPKMKRIVDRLNEYLVPKFGDNLVLTFADPVPENKSDDIEQVVKLMSSNVRQTMTVNEARSILDLDPLIGEEFDTISNQVIPVPQDTTPKSLKNITLTKHLRQSGINKWVDEQQKLFRLAQDIGKRVIKKKAVVKHTPTILEDGKLAERAYANFSFEEATNYWSKMVQIADVREKRFEDKVKLFLDGIEKDAISNLHQAVGKSKKLKKAFDLFDEEATTKTGIDLFTPLALEIAELSGSEVYQELKLDTLYVASEGLKKHVDAAVSEMVGSVVNTDKDKLSAILEAGIKEGQSVPQVEQAIRSQFGEFSKNQSTKIARTELLRYSNQGQLDAFRASGVVMGKQWFTARDSRVDEECAALDGKIVSLGSSYFETTYGSGEQPPLHPNCRCVLLPVLEPAKSISDEEYIRQLEDMVGISDES